MGTDVWSLVRAVAVQPGAEPSCHVLLGYGPIWPAGGSESALTTKVIDRRRNHSDPSSAELKWNRSSPTERRSTRVGTWSHIVDRVAIERRWPVALLVALLVIGPVILPGAVFNLDLVLVPDLDIPAGLLGSRP